MKHKVACRTKRTSTVQMDQREKPRNKKKIPGQSTWNLWWTKWHWDRFFPRVLRFYPANFIPPVLHYLEKRKKRIIFIIGLHNETQGCGVSVASAAGPFTHTHTQSYISTPLICLHEVHTDKFTCIFNRFNCQSCILYSEQNPSRVYLFFFLQFIFHYELLHHSQLLQLTKDLHIRHESMQCSSTL
jgi:hypothetical protein